MKKWLLAFICAVALLAPIEGKAVTTTKYALSSTAWTDLGVGPIIMSATGSIVYAIADTTPAIPLNEGLKILSGGSIVINTTSHVWAMNQSSSGASVYVAPILASSGGGSGGSYTLPTASTTTLGGVKIDGTSVTIDGGGVISAGGSITAGTTPTTGFVAGQLMYSDGTKAQNVKVDTNYVNWGSPTVPVYMGGYSGSTGGLIITSQNGPFGAYGLGINTIGATAGLNVDLGADGRGYFGFIHSNNYVNGGCETCFMSDAPGIASFRSTYSGASAATNLRVYNARTDASNGEWGGFDWKTTPNTLTIGTKANGTGIGRAVAIVSPANIDLAAGNSHLNMDSTGWWSMSGSINFGSSNLYFTSANVFVGPTNLPGVSCAAGTVSAATMVVTNGFVTHC